MWNDIGWYAATKDDEMQNDIGWCTTTKDDEVWNDKGWGICPTYFCGEEIFTNEIQQNTVRIYRCRLFEILT